MQNTKDLIEDYQSRRILKSEGNKVSPYVGFETFKKAFIKADQEAYKLYINSHSNFQFDKMVKDFYGDYLTSNCGSVKKYLKDILK